LGRIHPALTVATYVEALKAEVAAVRAHLPRSVRMARLHLGGGTPTILSPELMQELLGALYQAFDTAPGFEFSVEIDPTEAAPALLKTLADWNMTRASIGVQDFAPRVQEAIGRPQSFEDTRRVVDMLRVFGVGSINLDLLYGLPFQTRESMMATLEQVLSLTPDRLALFGYAHVPNMSKRQVMIDVSELPDTRMRYDLSQRAALRLEDAGFDALGIDHFARPEDSLARAKAARRMRRNFQGYTDDPCATLIGLGASAISQYREGYVQNAVATAAYHSHVEARGISGHKGYALTPEDKVIGDMVQQLMCYGAIDLDAVTERFPEQAQLVAAEAAALLTRFPDALDREASAVCMRPEARPLARIIAATMDVEDAMQQRYSLAV
jgi:oxygen-independent coproporphyrinogen-3 oxidase